MSFNKCETLAYTGLPGVLSIACVRHHMLRAPLFTSTATAVCSAAATTGVLYPWPAWSRRVPRARHGTRGDREIVPGAGHLQGPQAVKEPRGKEPGQEVRWGTLAVVFLGCSDFGMLRADARGRSAIGTKIARVSWWMHVTIVSASSRG